MCEPVDDFHRTVSLLVALAVYTHVPGADPEFIDAVGPALSASLPEPPPGVFPPGFDPRGGRGSSPGCPWWGRRRGRRG
ncbi:MULTISPECIES: hypothetical protein [unclassified Streptomyces]|uniref:hypothetical protein n=1 Tax=unclassified Streptomyces TaxID=2593676 RepID=UPI000C279291|nr:hypothetical protein [Streptomyces sp. CB01373]PJM96962.1 hypothetical protein CG719_02595 [Streptomyces sp. CB01373]